MVRGILRRPTTVLVVRPSGTIARLNIPYWWSASVFLRDMQLVNALEEGDIVILSSKEVYRKKREWLIPLK